MCRNDDVSQGTLRRRGELLASRFNESDLYTWRLFPCAVRAFRFVKAIAPQSSPVAVADTPRSTAAFTTDVPSMVAIVKRHVPTATVSSDVGQELQLRLPLGAVCDVSTPLRRA